MWGICGGILNGGKFVRYEDYIFAPLEESSEKERAENLRSLAEVAKSLIELGAKNDQVIDWLKGFKQYNLDKIEFDDSTEGLGEYEDITEMVEQELNGQDSFNVENADFKEADHPRDKDGKFVEKGGEDSKEAESIYKDEDKQELIKTKKARQETVNKATKELIAEFKKKGIKATEVDHSINRNLGFSNYFFVNGLEIRVSDHTKNPLYNSADINIIVDPDIDYSDRISEVVERLNKLNEEEFAYTKQVLDKAKQIINDNFVLDWISIYRKGKDFGKKRNLSPFKEGNYLRELATKYNIPYNYLNNIDFLNLIKEYQYSKGNKYFYDISQLDKAEAETDKGEKHNINNEGFDKSKHPQGKNGRFIPKGGESSKSPKNRKKRIVKLSKQEYARVMSEVRTNATKEQKANGAFLKCIGNHIYTCFFDEEEEDYNINDKRDID